MEGRRRRVVSQRSLLFDGRGRPARAGPPGALHLLVPLAGPLLGDLGGARGDLGAKQ